MASDSCCIALMPGRVVQINSNRALIPHSSALLFCFVIRVSFAEMQIVRCNSEFIVLCINTTNRMTYFYVLANVVVEETEIRLQSYAKIVEIACVITEIAKITKLI